MALRVIVFNVEHGACAFIKTPTQQTLLIDCGCTDAFSPPQYLSDYELADAAGHNGHQLTWMTVTHPHDDHIEDIGTVIEKCPPAMIRRQHYSWQDIKAASGGDYENLDIYSEWQEQYNQPAAHPDFGMDILHFSLTPEQAMELDESKYINNSGIVTVATFKGTSFTEKFLFGADVETAGWETLLERPSFKAAVKGVDFFVAPHHGHSSGFSSELFAATGRPIVNIVSVHHGDENVDSRYSQEAFAKGTKLGDETRRMVTTRTDGSVFIDVTDEGKYWLRTQHLPENRRNRAISFFNYL